MNQLDNLGAEYFHGVIGLIREGQGIRPARLTPAQLKHFERNAAWGVRARCPAGVTIEIQTDSPWLDIRFEVLSSCRKFLGIDIEIDGVLSHAVQIDEHQATYEGRLFDLPGSASRQVRVHLPYTVEVRLQEVGLSPGSSSRPIPRKPRSLLALGDSITQGMEGRSPFSSFPVQLARFMDMELLNQGVGGHHFDPASLDPAMPFKPDLVTVAYGTNDWYSGVPVDQFRANVREYLAKIRAAWPASRIAVLSPLWRLIGMEIRNPADLQTFRHVILEEAARVPGTIGIDGLMLVPNQPWYFADGTHPNDAGFLHYALNLCKALSKEQPGWTAHAVV